MVNHYIPDVGGILFGLTLTHNQGKRPAIVLSPQAYNQIGLMICCPITSKIKGYPFEVMIAGKIPNVALSDQIKNLDWRARNAQFKGKASQDEIDEIKEKIASLLDV